MVPSSSEIAPPNPGKPDIWTWLRQNLFNGWFNSLLTIVCLVGLVLGLQQLLTWIFLTAQWNVIQANLRLFFAGQYPVDLLWRLWLIAGMIVSLLGMTWGVVQRRGRLFNRSLLIAAAGVSAIALLAPLAFTARLWILALLLLGFGGATLGHHWADKASIGLYGLWLGVFPVSLWLLAGGLGLLEPVDTNLWTGLVLTLLTAVVSIFLSFPMGVLLALGRRSQLPILRILCVLYIEIIRGLPLIGLLFLAQVMLPLFFPPEVRLDRVVRAIAGLTLFSAAYLAENVRGGLQSIPKGQEEAAKALGLSTPFVVTLIILPQALKAVIPALVGQFIGLLKDTSLLSVVGLVELVGISRSILANPNYLGRYAEVYLFVGAIYWVFCYGMSLASRQLEQRLKVEG